jgi:SAM-dependent methyltransferase
MANSDIIGAGQESAHRAPRILDACCGGRMFWFDKRDANTVYLDKRIETVIMPDRTAKTGVQTMHVRPDIKADFTAMPFKSDTFDLVVFDPPHLLHNGAAGWLTKRYGRLTGDWKSELRQGFSECFRVLRMFGTLIFKWNETDVPISQVFALTNEKPLFGHKSGRLSNTHWVAFMKQARASCAQDSPAHYTMEICHTAPNTSSTPVLQGDLFAESKQACMQ